jgi:hypothetical protein
LVARSVSIATGVTYRKLDAPGLERFDGLGVFCDLGRSSGVGERMINVVQR